MDTKLGKAQCQIILKKSENVHKVCYDLNAKYEEYDKISEFLTLLKNKSFNLSIAEFDIINKNKGTFNDVSIQLFEERPISNNKKRCVDFDFLGKDPIDKPHVPIRETEIVELTGKAIPLNLSYDFFNDILRKYAIKEYTKKLAKINTEIIDLEIKMNNILDNKE